nr:rep protein [Cressdnaviricota sp.]
MSKARCWCFTFNNYTAEDVTRFSGLITAFDGLVQYVIFGREVGENGTPHLQGFIRLNARKSMRQMIQMCGQAHFTIARNVPASIQYCKKDGDFEEFGDATAGTSPGKRNDLEVFKDAVKASKENGEQITLDDIREHHSDVYARYPRFVFEYLDLHAIRVPVPAHPLRGWQQSLNALVNLEADRRKVIFVVDVRGNSGKSWFADYYCSLHDDAQIILPGKKLDMAYALVSTVRVLFIDAPRSKQGEFIQYDFLEDVKNGRVFSGKYESRMKRLGLVHVVVMMNEMPDMTKLSEDRYEIIEVTENNNN